MRDRPSQTAEVVCFMRASDLRREPSRRILTDPYAPWFLSPPWRALLEGVRATGAVGRALEERLGPGLTALVLARHRFIDDALQRALRQHPVEQLVLLGAGYDSRAWRLAEGLQDVQVFEVDHPATARRKQRIVAARVADLPVVRVRSVPVDFETQSLRARLLEGGFTPGLRTLWVWEGVSMYLSRDAVRGTLTTLADLSGPGSQLSMDFYTLDDRPSWTGTFWRTTPAVLHLLGEPVTFALHPGDAPAFLAAVGWTSTDVAPPAELRRRYVVDDRRIYPGLYTVTATVGGPGRR